MCRGIVRFHCVPSLETAGGCGFYSKLYTTIYSLPNFLLNFNLKFAYFSIFVDSTEKKCRVTQRLKSKKSAKRLRGTEFSRKNGNFIAVVIHLFDGRDLEIAPTLDSSVATWRSRVRRCTAHGVCLLLYRALENTQFLTAWSIISQSLFNSSWNARKVLLFSRRFSTYFSHSCGVSSTVSWIFLIFFRYLTAVR